MTSLGAPQWLFQQRSLERGIVLLPFELLPAKNVSRRKAQEDERTKSLAINACRAGGRAEGTSEQHRSWVRASRDTTATGCSARRCPPLCVRDTFTTNKSTMQTVSLVSCAARAKKAKHPGTPLISTRPHPAPKTNGRDLHCTTSTPADSDIPLLCATPARSGSCAL
jgi:hypothetical protein